MTAYDFPRIEEEANEVGKFRQAELAATFAAVLRKLNQMLPGFLIVPEVDGKFLVDSKTKYDPKAQHDTALTYDAKSKSVGLAISPPGTVKPWLMPIRARIAEVIKEKQEEPKQWVILLTCGESPLNIPLGVWNSPDAHARQAWIEKIDQTLTFGLRELATRIQTESTEVACMRPFRNNADCLRKALTP